MITKISIVYAPVPYIVLETDNVITTNGVGQAEIDFNELSAYVAILTQQQTALGKYVNFSKGTYTVNNRAFDAIVIAASDTPDPAAHEKTFQFQLGGVAFTGARNLDVFGGIKQSASQGITGQIPCLFYFELPVLRDGSGTIEDEYAITNPPGTVLLTQGNDGATWFLWFAAIDPADPVDGSTTVINCVANEFIKFESTIDPVSFFSAGFVIEGNIEGVQYPILANGTKYLKADVQYFLDAWIQGTAGTWDVYQYDANNNQLQLDVNVPIGFTLNIFDATVKRVEFRFVNVKQQNNISVGAFDFITLMNFGQSPTGATSPATTAGAFNQIQFQKVNDLGKLGVNTMNAALLPWNLTFYKKGVALNTVAIVQQAQDVTPSDPYWDAIQIGAGAPPPPPTKNVFVINNTGAAISITTNTATYNFAAGVNGNILCTPGGFVKNDSAAGHTFTFLTSLPAVVDGDEVPNPDILAVAASHVLNASLLNLNYIKVS